MTIDDRARRAAQDVQRDVDASVDSQRALEALVSTPRRRRLPRVAVAATVVVVLGLAGVVLALSEGDGGVQVNTEDTEDARSEPPERRPSIDQSFGAPTDGKDSLQLPVRAEPSTGLSPGDTVTVIGEGFTPGEGVGIVLCGGVAGDDTVHGAAACDLSTVTYLDPDGQGRAEGTFVVNRLVTSSALGPVDCAAPTARCAVAMGQVSDYDVSGFAPIAFRSDLPVLVAPEVEVGPDDGLHHGDDIVVTVTGLTGPVTGIELCRAEAGGAPRRSDLPAGVSALPGDPCWFYPVGVPGEANVFDPAGTALDPEGDGRVVVDLQAWRTFAVPDGGPVDCTVERCELRVFTPLDLTPVPVPLGFDPDGPIPEAPTISVDPAAGVVPGDEVTVTAEGLEPGLHIDVVGCTDLSSGQPCSEVTLATLAADDRGEGQVTFTTPAPAAVGADCTRPGACGITLGSIAYTQDQTTTRPVVAPEPIAGALAGNEAPDGGPGQSVPEAPR